MSRPDTLFDRQMHGIYISEAKRCSRVVIDEIERNKHPDPMNKYEVMPLWYHQKEFGAVLMRVYDSAPESIPAIVRSYIFCGNTREQMEKIFRDHLSGRNASTQSAELYRAIVDYIPTAQSRARASTATRNLGPEDVRQGLIWTIYNEEIYLAVQHGQELDAYIRVHLARVDLDEKSRAWALDCTPTPTPPAAPLSLRLSERDHRLQCSAYEIFLRKLEEEGRFKHACCRALQR